LAELILDRSLMPAISQPPWRAGRQATPEPAGDFEADVAVAIADAARLREAPGVQGATVAVLVDHSVGDDLADKGVPRPTRPLPRHLGYVGASAGQSVGLQELAHDPLRRAPARAIVMILLRPAIVGNGLSQRVDRSQGSAYERQKPNRPTMPRRRIRAWAAHLG
jgi:hypothetical protein